ncbi:S41 family peptidase [Massilia horti]|uniref:Peptidase S41 n=1 Tax=Massilia horti TaxID=2562153 RepID=A0A4Y9SUK8_9BURK|nr:S41 family peptidase [Massilia horti]TFW30118.1 peptidase S41 [Massilia horti]
MKLPSVTFVRPAGLPVALISSLALLSLLAGCGGGGGSSGSSQFPDPGSSSQGDPIPTDVFNTYWNLCAAPRKGVDIDGKPYPDRQGTLLDELKFLRGWANDYYLWYREIPTTYRMANFDNALDYFNVLKTPALTASGKPKDKYHFTYPSDEWDAMNTSGIDFGYGVTWTRNSATAPRTWQAAIVVPGSPAAVAGMRRGDLLVRVDGVDFVNANDKASVDRINAGLFPEREGERHTFTVRRANVDIAMTLAAANVVSDPVQNVKVIDTPTGKVGYLTFSSHNAVSEKQLIDAFNQLKAAGATDLVIDMRYNGGGLLYLASELAYMIAGPARTKNMTFERLQYNDKTPPQAPIPFRSTAYGFETANPATPGQALPYLGLDRVTVLTTAGTCSASEAVINGLRGVDVEVNLIGGQTCGKPYGFTPTPNCGTTYFSVEFGGVNQKGFGDYADGMAPTCNVADDLSHEVGDPAEGLLAAALNYRVTNACPPVLMARAMSSSSSSSTPAPTPMTLVRPEAKEISIYTRPR